MSLKGKLEAIIYAAEEPVTVDQMAALLKHDVLADLAAAAAASDQLTFETSEADSEDQIPAEETPAEPKLEAAGEDVAAGTTLPAAKKKAKDPELAAVKAKLREVLAELLQDYEDDVRGVEIRQIAGGYRMATKPEHHDLVVGFAKSLKPPIRLSLQALETLAVVAYKQPVTAPEVSEIRGVDSSGVIATLLDRKLVTTAGRKQVIGRPILYKTTKEFLLRFGLKDVNELPSMEEFEKLGEAGQGVVLEPDQPSPENIATSSEAQRSDDAMMAREDEMVAEEAPAASDQPEPTETHASSETESESSAETADVHGSHTEND